MRLLKRKIAIARDRLLNKGSDSSLKIKKKPIEKVYSSSSDSESSSKRSRVTGEPQSKYSDRCLKNAAKNYGRAICNFILSEPLAEPYMIPLAAEFKVEIKKFKTYVKDKKDGLDGIDSFRDMLLIREKDSKTTSDFKAMFQRMGEVFMKYFAVNWIFGGKLTYRLEYLRFRHKMLRRIQNPHLFTYIR